MTEQRDVAHLEYISECAALIRDYTKVIGSITPLLKEA